MFQVQYDFSNIKQVFVTGTLEVPQAFSVSLLSLVGNFQININKIEDIDFLEPTDAVMTNDSDLELELESSKVKVLPLDLEKLVPVLFQNKAFEKDLLDKIIPLFDSEQSMGWMAYLKLHIALDFAWVCQVLARLVWASIVSEYKVQENLTRLAEENPAEEIEKGFYLVPGSRDLETQDFYLKLHKTKILDILKDKGQKAAHMIFRDVSGQWQSTYLSVKPTKETNHDLVFPAESTIREIVINIKKEKKEKR